MDKLRRALSGNDNADDEDSTTGIIPVIFFKYSVCVCVCVCVCARARACANIYMCLSAYADMDVIYHFFKWLPVVLVAVSIAVTQ